MSGSPIDLGIDLGTTFSVLAVSGRVALTPDYPAGIYLAACDVTVIPTPYGEASFASVMAVDPAAPEAPSFATDALQGIEDGFAPVSFSKRKMGTHELIACGATTTTAKSVATGFLRYLKGCAEQALGRPVQRAVVTHPAYFDRAAVEETREAAIAAGFDMGLPEQTLMEPVAAALAYTRADPRDPLRVLTYDLGGGTFDATCLERRSGLIAMRSFDGDPLLGGYNFDRCLANWLLDRLRSRGCRIALDESDPAGRARLARLLRLAERTKIALAEAADADTPVLCRGRGILVDDNGRELPIDERITRAAFVDMIRDGLARTVEQARQALAKAELEPAELDEILLVGGSSRAPWVAEAIAAAFPGVSCRLFEPDLCVGAGAAIYAAMVLPACAHTESFEWLLEVPVASPLDRIHVAGRVRSVPAAAAPASAGAVVLARTDGSLRLQAALAATGAFLFEQVDLFDDGANTFELTLLDTAGAPLARHEFSVGYTPDGGEASAVVSVLPRTLAIETLDGMVPLAEAGAALPARCERTFLRQNDSPSIELRLFQDHAVVGEIGIDGIPPQLGRGALVQLVVEVTGAGQVRGLATVGGADDAARLSVPVQVRIRAPEIAPTEQLEQRLHALRSQWARIEAEDGRRGAALAPPATRLLRQLDTLFGQLPLERQEIHAGLGELDRLLNPPADDMLPTREEFERDVQRCRAALTALQQSGAPAGTTPRQAAQRGARAAGLLESLARVEAEAADAHRRRDRRAWARLHEAVETLDRQSRPVRRAAADSSLPTAAVKLFASMEVAREVARLNQRSADLLAQGRLGNWQGEIGRLFQALNTALERIHGIDDGLPVEQGRARVARVLAAELEPARRDIGSLGVHIASVDAEALRAARLPGAAHAVAKNEGPTTPPLLAAMQWGQGALFEALLAPGVDVDSDCGEGLTPLLIAAHRGLADFVRELLRRHAAVDARNTNGWTALMLAAQEGHTEVAALLCEHGADLEAGTPQGFTALMIAAHFGRLSVLDLLIERGAALDRCSQAQWSALMHAAAAGQAASVRRLAQAGADLGVCDERGGTALFVAAGHGQVAVVETLLQAGMDPNALRHADRGNPLILAAWEGHGGVVERLLPLIRDLEQRDKDGDTALANATLQDHLEVLERLIAFGAVVDTANDRGITPLMVAAAHGRLDATRLLLAHGADVGRRDHDGRNAWSIALAGGHDAVAAAIEAATTAAPADGMGSSALP